MGTKVVNPVFDIIRDDGFIMTITINSYDFSLVTGTGFSAFMQDFSGSAANRDKC
jgi:hypothetical protein